MKTYSKNVISLEAAGLMISSAIAKAKELGINISVTIVDDGGNVKMFARMDHAPLISVDASRKKAITAVGFGIPTGQPWFDFIKDDPMLREGVHAFKDYILLGGGMPVTVEGQMAGAIGISGGHYEHDQLCAAAALEALSII